MSNKIKINVYSHHFTLDLPTYQDMFGYEKTGREHSILKEFLRRNDQWVSVKIRGRFVREIKASFYASNHTQSQYRIHINQLNDCLLHFSNCGYKDDRIEITIHDPDKIDWPIVNNKLQERFTLKPIQVEAIQYCLDYKSHRAKLIELITGEGKSLVSMGTVASTQSRFVMVVKAEYIEKWYSDVLSSMEIDKDEIYVCRGSKSLKDLFLISQDGRINQYKAILIAVPTIRNYITRYETYGKAFMEEDGYLVMPYDYCQALGARVLLIDEGHQDFHFIFRLILYTHCQISVTTTATLIPDDSFLKKMAGIMYPLDTRFNPGTINQYVECRALFYRFKQPEYLRYKGTQGYSHTEFEKSVMRYVPNEKAYYKMITSIIDNQFVPNHKPGYKAIIFCSTIKMCTQLTDHLKTCYPQYDVRRYVGEDPYEDLIDADIRVTTPGSAGTAVDIPGLYLGIMTVAIGSSQMNKQVMGRLREMKKGNPIHPDGETPYFYWLVCEDIQQHIRYHEEKKHLFRDKMKGYQLLRYPELIGKPDKQQFTFW